MRKVPSHPMIFIRINCTDSKSWKLTQVWGPSYKLIAGFRDFKYYNCCEKKSVCLHLLLFSLEISVLMSEISARGCCSQSKFDAEMTTWFEIECFSEINLKFDLISHWKAKKRLIFHLINTISSNFEGLIRYSWILTFD